MPSIKVGMARGKVPDVTQGFLSVGSERFASIMAPFRILFVHRNVIQRFIFRDIRGRYANSVMGISWAVIQPVVLLLLYTFVFSMILKVRLGGAEGTASFAMYLFCGMLPWLAFAEGVSRSASVILENVQLIKKVVFPSEILPAYVVGSALVMEFIGLVIFLIAVSIFYHVPGWTLLALPPVIALQVMFTLGLGWLVASINVFLRDVGQLLGLGLTLWMFLTPIFYPAEMIPPEFRFALTWNPMHHLIQAYRDVILDRQLPDFSQTLPLTLIALATFLAGSWFFRRSKNAFVDVI